MCPNDDDSFEKTASQIGFDPALSKVISDSSKQNKSNTISPRKYQKVDCRRGKGPRNLEIGLIPIQGPEDFNLRTFVTDIVSSKCK